MVVLCVPTRTRTRTTHPHLTDYLWLPSQAALGKKVLLVPVVFQVLLVLLGQQEVVVLLAHLDFLVSQEPRVSAGRDSKGNVELRANKDPEVTRTSSRWWEKYREAELPFP